jgi:hypothetical protein
MSLIKIRNNSSSKTDPCRTPLVTSFHVDAEANLEYSVEITPIGIVKFADAAVITAENLLCMVSLNASEGLISYLIFQHMASVSSLMNYRVGRTG